MWVMGAHAENIFKIKSNTVINDEWRKFHHCSKYLKSRVQHMKKTLWGRNKCRGSQLVLSLGPKGPTGFQKEVLLVLKITSEIIASAPLPWLLVLQAIFVPTWKWHKGTSLQLKSRYLRVSQLCGQNKYPEVPAAGVLPWNQGQDFQHFEIADFTLLNTCWASSWEWPPRVFGRIWKEMGSVVHTLSLPEATLSCLWQMQLKRT